MKKHLFKVNVLILVFLLIQGCKKELINAEITPEPKALADHQSLKLLSILQDQHYMLNVVKTIGETERPNFSFYNEVLKRQKEIVADLTLTYHLRENAKQTINEAIQTYRERLIKTGQKDKWRLELLPKWPTNISKNVSEPATSGKGKLANKVLSIDLNTVQIDMLNWYALEEEFVALMYAYGVCEQRMSGFMIQFYQIKERYQYAYYNNTQFASDVLFRMELNNLWFATGLPNIGCGETNPYPTDPGIPPIDNGGGGGGGYSGSSDFPDQPILPGQEHEAIDVKKYTKCFDNIPNSGATYKVIVQVLEPVPGTSFNYGLVNGVGHTAITLIKQGSNGIKVTQTVGFYPEGNPFSSPSKMVDNSDETDYTIRMIFDMGSNSTDFNKILTSVSNPPPQYNLLGMNCTSFVVGVCNQGSLTLPSAVTTVGIPGPGGATTAMTPGGLGSSMRAAHSNGDNRISSGSTSTQNNPSSNGPCN